MLLNNSKDVIIRSRPRGRAKRQPLDTDAILLGGGSRATPAKLAASLRSEYG